MAQATYTVVIPSRNRQRYAVEAVRSVLLAERDDVQIIVCDNSDDAALLPRLLAEAGLSGRVELLESADGHLSMRQNWERAVPRLTGEWICFIGDDDGVLPTAFSIMDELRRLFSPRVFTWAPTYYRWPCFPEADAGLLEFNAFEFEAAFLKSAPYLQAHQEWDTQDKWPFAGPGVYHCFAHRSVIEEVCEEFGEYFINYVVDYASAITNCLFVDEFMFLRWPLTIMGACGASNTAGLTASGAAKKQIEQIKKENPRTRPFYEEFAGSRLHVPSVIAGYREIMDRIGLPFHMTPGKFLRSCLLELRFVRDAEVFAAEKARMLDFQAKHGLSGLPIAETMRTDTVFEKGYAPQPTRRLRMDTGALGWRGVHDVARNFHALIQNEDTVRTCVRVLAERAVEKYPEFHHPEIRARLEAARAGQDAAIAAAQRALAAGAAGGEARA